MTVRESVKSLTLNTKRSVSIPAFELRLLYDPKKTIRQTYYLLSYHGKIRALTVNANEKVPGTDLT